MKSNFKMESNTHTKYTKVSLETIQDSDMIETHFYHKVNNKETKVLTVHNFVECNKLYTLVVDNTTGEVIKRITTPL